MVVVHLLYVYWVFMKSGWASVVMGSAELYCSLSKI